MLLNGLNSQKLKILNRSVRNYCAIRFTCAQVKSTCVGNPNEKFDYFHAYVLHIAAISTKLSNSPDPEISDNKSIRDWV